MPPMIMSKTVRITRPKPYSLRRPMRDIKNQDEMVPNMPRPYWPMLRSNEALTGTPACWRKKVDCSSGRRNGQATVLTRRPSAEEGWRATACGTSPAALPQEGGDGTHVAHEGAPTQVLDHPHAAGNLRTTAVDASEAILVRCAGGNALLELVRVLHHRHLVKKRTSVLVRPRRLVRNRAREGTYGVVLVRRPKHDSQYNATLA